MSEIINELITERIKRLEDIKQRVDALAKQIEAAQQQQRALYNVGLETKGSIEVLVEARDKEKAKAEQEAEKAKEVAAVGSIEVVTEVPNPAVEVK